MNESIEIEYSTKEIHEARESLVLRLQHVGLAFGLLAFLGLVSLYPAIVGIPVLLTFAGAYVAFALIFIYRRFFSYRFRSVFLVAIFSLTGALMLAIRGLPDLGIAILIVAPIIAVLLINRVAAILTIIISLIYIALIGELTIYGVIGSHLQDHAYAAYWSNWVDVMVGTLFVAVIVVAVVDGINSRLLESIGALNNRTSALERTNKQLEDEINERQLTEKELHLKDSAVDSALNGVGFADMDGNLIYANRSYLELWGYKIIDNIIGKPMTEHWANSEETGRAMRETIRSGHSRGILEARRQDGTTFISQYAATLILDKDRQPVCIVGIFDDITDQVRLKDELTEEVAWRKVIQEAGNLLNSQLDVGDSFKLIAVALRELVPVDSMMIVLHQDDQVVFEVVETRENNSTTINPRISVPFAGSFLEHMKERGHTLLVEELENQCNFPEDIIIRGDAMRSCVRLPLYSGGKFLGMLALASHQPHAFNRPHLPHMESLALQIAHTVANTQRYQQVRGEARQLAVIVREVHHRIKNNLQGIIGLFDDYLKKQPKLAPVLNSAISQLYAVAEVHNLLSHHAHETVNWHSLIQGVCQATSDLSPHQFENVLPLETANANIAASEAVPMALALNELIQNAINHGYPDGRTGTIQISIENKPSDSSVHLIVANDGVAPEQALNGDTGEGFGLGLTLVKSLLPTDARIQIKHRDNWTVAEVSLPNNAFLEVGELRP